MKSGSLTKLMGFTDLYLILLLWTETFTMMHFLFQLLTMSTLLSVFGWILFHKMHTKHSVLSKGNKSCKLINWPGANARTLPQVWFWLENVLAYKKGGVYWLLMKSELWACTLSSRFRLSGKCGLTLQELILFAAELIATVGLSFSWWWLAFFSVRWSMTGNLEQNEQQRWSHFKYL